MKHLACIAVTLPAIAPGAQARGRVRLLANARILVPLGQDEGLRSAAIMPIVSAVRGEGRGATAAVANLNCTSAHARRSRARRAAFRPCRRLPTRGRGSPRPIETQAKDPPSWRCADSR